MTDQQISFDDGAAYEEFMGAWSRLVGDEFLDWLSLPTGLRWIDVGCGNGAFTEMLVRRCAASEVQGVDPSEAQLEYARTWRSQGAVDFKLGDAMALPFAADRFDAAVMALVIFFVPEPIKGVMEMARVVKAGGSVSAYAWDMHGSGFPFAALQEEMAALGIPPLWPPSADASRIDTMRELWTAAGLERIETREITVQRTFPDFETFWRIAQTGPRMAPKISTLQGDDKDLLKSRVCARLRPDRTGQITYTARANAVKGRVPA